MTEGTELLIARVAGMDDEVMSRPSVLPGWTRKHVVAHVAANADAIGHLVHWAVSGIETPMYRSMEERADGIAQGALLSASALESWLTRSAESLENAMARMTNEQWSTPVVTAQGRTVPATETPWMRAREVCVHLVDLGVGATFDDVPAGFDDALCDDIRNRRGMAVLPSEVAGAPLSEVTAWLAGRPHSVTGAPVLTPWL